MTYLRRRSGLLAAMLALLASPFASLPEAVVAQAPSECFDPSDPTPETYGPTDISGVTGNRRLSAAVNPDATITVFKWPSPSFYDHIKYRTTDRSKPRYGAGINDGAFFGIAWKSPKTQWKFRWLRSLPSRQRFGDDDGDEIVTRFVARRPGLRIVVRDVVAHDRDVLARRVVVKRAERSAVRKVRIISFANFNPVVSKTAQAPVQDWCFEEQNDDGAAYRTKRDAVVQTRSGVDESTGQASSVALAMGFDRRSDGHHIGQDTFQTGGMGLSAYADAMDARLSGNDSAGGQVDAAMAVTMGLRRVRRAATLFAIAAAPDRRRALQRLSGVRDQGFGSMRAAKARWYERWLAGAPLPRGAPAPVTRLSKRALISLRQAMDGSTAETFEEGTPMPPGGLIVASIATQAPYGQDWIRDGAYLNRMLDVAGKHGAVARHNLRYAVLQHATGDPARGGQPIPPGNWAMNYYADGIVGGPIPYEIDETGYGIWTLWDHYLQTGDRDYLFKDHGGVVYLAIQRAAQYLTDVCRDPSTGLQCVANEDDNPDPRRTVYGAALAWLGLDSAARAAREKGTVEALANAQRWEARRDELRAAIEDNFFDPECECYTTDYGVGGTMLWPVSLVAPTSARGQAQAEVNWAGASDSFADKRTRGGYEAKALLGNAHAWGGRPARLQQLKTGLEWLAEVATTDETGILGEAWMRYPDEDSPVATMVSQPHVSQQALFYLAALQVYGEAPYRF